jgi:hypothetical protein
LAIAYTAQGKTAEAVQSLYTALRAEDRLIAEIFAVGDARQRMAVLSSRQHRLNHLLSLAITDSAHDNEALQFALEHVIRRKVLEAEPPLAQRDNELATRFPGNAEVISKRAALRRQLAIARLQVPRVMQGNYRSRIATWSEELTALDRQLAAAIPEERIWQQRVTANRWTIAGNMAQRSALLECVRFTQLDIVELRKQHRAVWADDRYAAFVLSSQDNQKISVIDLGRAETLELAMMQNDPHLGSPPVGLAAPFESVLEDVAECRHVYFAGDAALAKLSTTQVGLLVGLATESVEVLWCGADLLRAA